MPRIESEERSGGLVDSTIRGAYNRGQSMVSNPPFMSASPSAGVPAARCIGGRALPPGAFSFCLKKRLALADYAGERGEASSMSEEPKRTTGTTAPDQTQLAALGLGRCRACGISMDARYQPGPDCYDCKRLRGFLKPLLEELRRIAVALEK